MERTAGTYGTVLDGPPPAWTEDPEARRGPEIPGLVRAYLESRAHGLDPTPDLAGAWEEFYRLFSPRIRAFLGTFGLSPEDREDCLQELWSRIVTRPEALPLGPSRGQLAAWMRRVARNLAVDAIRRRRRDPSGWDAGALGLVDTQPGPDVDFDLRATRARVHLVLAELAARAPGPSFRVLYLRTIEGRSTAEVAEALGLTPDQVRFRLHRMTRKFRDLFDPASALDRGAGGRIRDRRATSAARERPS